MRLPSPCSVVLVFSCCELVGAVRDNVPAVFSPTSSAGDKHRVHLSPVPLQSKQRVDSDVHRLSNETSHRDVRPQRLSTVTTPLMKMESRLVIMYPFTTQSTTSGQVRSLDRLGSLHPTASDLLLTARGETASALLSDWMWTRQFLHGNVFLKYQEL